MKIFNQTKNSLLAEKIEMANTPILRMKGLLGRNSLKDNEAMIITSCNSIHTFFMRFAIDALFLDKQNKVVGLKENMLPFRITRIFPRANQVVELSAHKISQSRTQLNDLIQIEK